MKQKLLLIIVLFIVFFIGFLSGSLWQTLLQNLRQPNAEQTVKIDVPKKNDSSKGSAEIPMEDEKISQALADPDFKHVHDFLMREKPIQMNINSGK